MQRANTVSLVGKVSRVSALRYTPAGVAIIEFTLAVNQSCLGEVTVGYFTALASGDLAEEIAPKLKIGKRVDLEGQLWSRDYRNRQGTQLNETKIVIERIGGGS